MARTESFRHPFVVHSAALRRVPATVRHEVRHGAIEGLGIVGVTVPDEADVDIDVVLASYPGGVMATGTVSAPWRGECRRCGGPVVGDVVVTVRERFVVGTANAGDSPSAATGHARSTAPASSAEDDEAYAMVGDELDLEPLARDAVLLELPLAPLCADDCLGLCPTCGTDMNVGTCECEAPADPRWSGLDALRDGEGGCVP